MAPLVPNQVAREYLRPERRHKVDSKLNLRVDVAPITFDPTYSVAPDSATACLRCSGLLGSTASVSTEVMVIQKICEEAGR